MSTMSSVSAMTDGEMSDNSFSVDPSCSPGATVDTSGIKKEARSRPGAAASVAPFMKSGIDQEMGELSELFAPDAFLLSTVLDTEEMEATAGAAEAVSVTAMSIEPTVEEDTKPDVAKSAAAVAAAAATAGRGLRERQPVQAATTAPVSSALSTGAFVAQQQPAGTIAAAAASAAATATATPASAKPACRCGEPACPSLITSLARKRQSEYYSLSAGVAGGEGPAPLSFVTGMPYAHQSSRQRKRQRSLAPVLSASRTVTYECALCKESYQSEISSNPWWSLFRHECPRCHRMQIPRVDATSAAVSVDYIHAVCAEEGEGCDSDG